MSIWYQQFLPAVIFLTTIFFHVSKKNVEFALAYGIQSLAIALILLGSFLGSQSLPLLLIIALVALIKVVLAPRFLIGLVKKHGVKFSSSSYLNTPLTLVAIISIVAVVQSRVFAPLGALVPQNAEQILLAVSGMLVSLFLIINRKGALSQIVGVLSLENGILVFALFSGLEQSAALQVGILFDMVVWFIIAAGFVSMIYRHFGTLDITEMKHLTD